MRPSVRVLVLAATSVVTPLVVGGCGETITPRPDVAAHGWSAVAIVCGYREAPDALSSLRRGQVVRLGSDPREVLATARCAPNGVRDGGGDQPELRVRPDRSYFVVSTGDDRIDVVLVDVDATADPVELLGEHHVVAAGCGRTDEYRGQLMLLVEGPAGARDPTVRLEELPLPC